MKIEKECPCCGVTYKIAYVIPQDEEFKDYDFQDETFEETEELEPEFCPFCGSHEDEEPSDDDE